MSEDLVIRHYDYVLGPTQDGRLTTVRAGQTIEGVTLYTDLDAPFVMRSRAVRQTYVVATEDYAGLNHILARHYRPNGSQCSQGYVRQGLVGPYMGMVGRPMPLLNEIFFPPGSPIRVDVQNDGAANLSGVTFYFRGIKIFKRGAVKAYGYPERFSPFPYTYVQTLDNLPVTTVLNRNVLSIKTDADFVLQGIQAGLPFSTTPVLEVSILLKDEDQKPYANAPVNIDVLCGNSGYGAIFPVNGANAIAPVAGGPNAMGLLYPEIYVPANNVMYFDVSRTDAAYTGAAAVDFPIAFIGTKVFKK